MFSFFRYLKPRPSVKSYSVEELQAAHASGDTEHLHSTEASQHVGDFVFGGIDGVVTTFAVVAGVAGADLSAAVVLILGIANLLADGFAMGVGNYLSIKSEHERYQHELEEERHEIEVVPEHEKKEIEDIYREKGFEGEALRLAVETITADKERWLQTMMQEELGLSKDTRSPVKGGFVTYVAFITIGLVPLLSFVVALFWKGIGEYTFPLSILLTAMAMFGIGALKTVVVSRSWWKSGFETFFMGGAAAVVAYIVGFLLRGISL